MKRLIVTALAALFLVSLGGTAFAAKPKGELRAKFYDFSDQLIDGEIKKPTALYTDARQKVKFDRLMRLKKSFLQPLKETSKQRVFK